MAVSHFANDPSAVAVYALWELWAWQPGSSHTSPDEELRRSFRRRETPKFFRSDRKMTPAQPEAQVLYRTLAWCAVARGASDAERDQSRSAYTPGKREPQTGDDPRDPHRPGT